MASPLEAFGKAQRLRNSVLLFFAELKASPGLDVECCPGCMQAIGKTLGVTHKGGRARILANANKDPIPRGPWPGYRASAHVLEQLLVDAIRRPPQGQLAQGRQIGRREIVLEGALGLLGDVDLALLEALDQVVGRQVNELDGICAVENGIGHVSRTRTRVICATTSFRLSMCWMLTVV